MADAQGIRRVMLAGSFNEMTQSAIAGNGTVLMANTATHITDSDPDADRSTAIAVDPD
mgnify:CR=1 FL=1